MFLCALITTLFHHLNLSKISYNIANMPRLQQAMGLLKEVFYDHAKLTRDKDTMIRPEVHYMLRKEFPDADKDYAAVRTFFSQLDADRDGVVTFKEFVAIVNDFQLMFS